MWESESSRLPPLSAVFRRLLAVDRLEKILLRNNFSAGSTGSALEFLLRHVSNSIEKGTYAREISLPLLQHLIKSEQPRYRKNALLILKWLFGKVDSGLSLSKSLVDIIESSEYDHQTKLGSCIVIRDLVENSPALKRECGDVQASFLSISEPTTNGSAHSITVFATCIPQLVKLICNASAKEGNSKTPTRLTMAAADCALTITIALAAGGCVSDTSSDEQDSSILEGTEKWEVILWHELDDLTVLVSELQQWNVKSRALHAIGLDQVQKLLHALATFWNFSKDAIAYSVLRYLWRQCARFMISQDHNFSSATVEFSLQELLNAFKFYMPHLDGNNNKKMMRKHILACLALCLGRIGREPFEALIVKFEEQLLEVLYSELMRNDNETASIAVSIAKTIIFRQEFFTSNLKMDTLAPLVMQLLAREDTTADAVVRLASEYLSLNLASHHLEGIFQMLDSNGRQNALNVIDQLLQIASEDDNKSSLRHSLVKYFLQQLGDEELLNRSAATSLFATAEPDFMMPELIRFIYSSNAKLQSLASTTLMSVLKHHPHQQQQVISVLLDTLGNVQVSDINGKAKPNTEKVMRLIPTWASTVDNWEPLIHFILDRMFGDPKNMLFPRFLGEISTHLAESADIVFPRIFQAMLQSSTYDKDEMQVFHKLSPLLVLRVLPLEAYNHYEYSKLYGESSSVVCFLLDWMCDASENVRKVSAELIACFLPEALVPLLTKRLELATHRHDVVAVKSCIYAVCTSLMLRGSDTLAHPMMPRVRSLLVDILLWPILSNEIQKVQHGCIDCFAIMIRTQSRPYISVLESSILHAVVSCLSNGKHSISLLSSSSSSSSSSSATAAAADADDDDVNVLPTTTFRICMANILISACSKIPNEPSVHHEFGSVVVAAALNLIKVEKCMIVRTACLQVLLHASYGLKAASSSLGRMYGSDVLTAALQALEGGKEEEERMAAAKLVAALLANEDTKLVAAVRILTVRACLERISDDEDSSSSLRDVCGSLLSCLRE